MATLQLHSPVWYAAVMDVADVPALAVRETHVLNRGPGAVRSPADRMFGV